MPTVMIILNMTLCAAIVLAIVGLCALGIIVDRPFAAYLTARYRGPRRRALDAGA